MAISRKSLITQGLEQAVKTQEDHIDAQLLKAGYTGGQVYVYPTSKENLPEAVVAELIKRYLDAGWNRMKYFHDQCDGAWFELS